MSQEIGVRAAASRYRLAPMKAQTACHSGELLGRGRGTSIEFLEHREYASGDDLRHLDWFTFARSDQLMVRVYRQEICSSLDIVLDASRSMATNSVKQQLAQQLAELFAVLPGGVESSPVIWVLDDRRPFESIRSLNLDRLASIEFCGTHSMSDPIRQQEIPFRTKSHRIVVSDFLFPMQPKEFVSQLSLGCGSLSLIQVLSSWEAQPTRTGTTRLVDIEDGAELDLVLSDQVIASYLHKLECLQGDLARHCRCAGANFVTVIAEHGLAEICRHALCRAEILQPL